MRARLLAASLPARRTLRRSICAFVCVVLTWGKAGAAEELRYDVTFAGAPSATIAELVKRVSKLESERKKGRWRGAHQDGLTTSTTG